VFCGEIQSTLSVLRQDPISLGVLQSDHLLVFPARFNLPWCLAVGFEHKLQFSCELSASVQVFGEFWFGVCGISASLCLV
jgi:predicted Kef-type K+ transport protein